MWVIAAYILSMYIQLKSISFTLGLFISPNFILSTWFGNLHTLHFTRCKPLGKRWSLGLTLYMDTYANNKLPSIWQFIHPPRNHPTAYSTVLDPESKYLTLLIPISIENLFNILIIRIKSRLHESLGRKLKLKLIKQKERKEKQKEWLCLGLNQGPPVC